MKHLKQGKGFYREVFLLMLPMLVQNLITNALALADTFMVGAVGETELAAVTMANAPFFMVMLLCFGLQGGATILTAQYHGKGNLDAISRVLGVGLYVSAGITFILGLIFVGFAENIMTLLTNNESLYVLGADYSRTVAFAYFFGAISGMYLAVQRSTGNPKMGAAVLGISGVLNVFFNWIFIFGNLGFSPMGVKGAALGTLLARAIELIITIICAVRDKRLNVRIGLVLKPGGLMARDYARYALPVALNELLWSGAMTIYSVIMGHMPNNTPILAAYTISGNIDRLLAVGNFAIGGCASVVIGREIGRGNSDEVYSKGVALNFVAICVGCVSMMISVVFRLFFARQFVFPLLSLGGEAQELALFMLAVIAVIQPLRAANMTNIVGVMRGGGDVKFGLLVDVIPLYLFCIPLAAVTGLVLDLGIKAVYACIVIDDFIKAVMCFGRIKSKKWINDLTR